MTKVPSSKSLDMNIQQGMNTEPRKGTIAKVEGGGAMERGIARYT